MQIETSASQEEGARMIKVEYEFGKNLAETTKLFSEELCYSKLIAMLKVDLQSSIRIWLKKGLKDAEIQAKVKEWKPGMRQPGKSKAEKLTSLFNQLSAEEKAAIKKQLGLK